MAECEIDTIYEIETLPAAAPVTADECFERGMIFSSGRAGAVDMVAAHMWFNIAATRGNKDAVALRREIAQQLSDAEIGAAQKAARDWLKAQPVVVPIVVEPMRVAA